MILVLDLDDTLLRGDKSVSAGSTAALQRWFAGGHEVVIATGRPPRSVDEVLPEARMSSPRDPARRGGHVTIDHPRFAELMPELWRRGVIPDFRRPSGIRLGMSPLSTSFAEVDLAVHTIRELLA